MRTKATTTQFRQRAHSRRASTRRLRSLLKLMRREVNLLKLYPMQVYQRLRSIGIAWLSMKALIAQLGLNIDEWAAKKSADHSPMGR